MQINLLNNQQVINWCYKPFTKYSLVNTSNEELLKVSKKEEKDWANAILGANRKQWTTELCQELVRETLVSLGKKNIRTGEAVMSTIGKKKYQPDLECDDYVYEVKGRSWTTPGTAGEKILGVPLKYGELPVLLHKPLKIILVGYQEYEARNHYAFGDLLNKKNQTKQLKDSLEHFERQDIEYTGLTEMLKELELVYKT